MRPATWETASSSFLVAGLLVLAAVLFDAHPAFAQAEEACPLPAGATPVAPPRVTAQQVENGTGSLMDFALIARERSREHAQGATTAAQGLYIACLVRQEGGPWRSGSTYLVSLTLDGRVFIHAKNMALSGGLLQPLIYAEILSALGVSPADLANLASPDPATRGGAVAALIATLSREPDAAFDATVPIPGVRPGIPGASGYASVYVSSDLGSPIVLLAGFDLDASHLAPEAIDYGDPAVTARDVVDRETLKAFVTQAGNYFLEIIGTGDAAAASRARIALRDPTGPWRHGSVYLYVLDLASNVISFHAAFPDRFEYRPLVPTVRDAVTGELVLPQVIAAAKSGPEGGFVEYYWDDPNDDTDRADVLKLGYARQFTGQVQRPDGNVVPVDVIIGSGLYGSAAEVDPVGRNAVVESVLPQVMRAMTASTVDAVSSRVQQASSGAPQASSASFGGASTLSDALLANGAALQNGTFDPVRLLARSSFTLPLDAADDGGSGPFGNLTLWGSGDLRNLSGGGGRTVDYDGDVVSANLGIDARLGADMLAGVALSRSRGSVDYTAANASGELTTTLTSINPYLGWQMQDGMNLWAMAGYGSGEVEIVDPAGTQARDLTQQMVAAGASGTLVSSDELIEGGTTRLKLKGETASTRAEVDGSGSSPSTSLSVSRHRLMLEGSHDQELASGATLTPSIEIGMRFEGGDGETGNGVEAGGRLRYSDAASGLTLEGRIRTLLTHSGDYEEWGVSGLARLDPGAAGRGLAISLQPAWGRTAGGVQSLWENRQIAGAAFADQADVRVNAEIGYRLVAGRGLGMVTPYAGIGLVGERARSWRAGARWQLSSDAKLSLEGTRHEATNDDGPEHGLMLRCALYW